MIFHTYNKSSSKHEVTLAILTLIVIDLRKLLITFRIFEFLIIFILEFLPM